MTPAPTVAVPAPGPTLPVPPVVGPTPTVSPTPTASPRRHRRSTTFRGVVDSDGRVSFRVRAGTGSLRTTVRSSRETSLRVLRVPGGKVVYRRSAGTALLAVRQVPAGRYRVVVTARPGTHFRLTVTRAAG